MATVETAFAVVVTLLAAICVILALVWAICWFWFALLRVLAANRPPDPDERFWADQRALTEPK
jgi:hypothetical protein